MFFKDSIVKINIFYVFVKVDNLTDPDTNCGLDPDPNTVFWIHHNTGRMLTLCVSRFSWPSCRRWRRT